MYHDPGGLQVENYTIFAKMHVLFNTKILYEISLKWLRTLSTCKRFSCYSHAWSMLGGDLVVSLMSMNKYADRQQFLGQIILQL